VMHNLILAEWHMVATISLLGCFLAFWTVNECAKAPCLILLVLWGYMQSSCKEHHWANYSVIQPPCIIDLQLPAINWAPVLWKTDQGKISAPHRLLAQSVHNTGNGSACAQY
jgi:hypothetical protein